ADLYDAAAEKHRNEIPDDDPDVFEMMRQRDVQAGRQLEDPGKLDQKLRRTSRDRCPGHDDGETIEAHVSAGGQHGADHDQVPQDRRAVRKKEAAMAVENSQTP